MTDQQQAAQAQGSGAADFNIPDSVRQQFGDLIDLILTSESMNDEERQYWIDLLPVMSEEQVQNLRSILTNEKTQLAAIDAKYATRNAAPAADIAKIGEERRSNRAELQSQENAARVHEDAASEELLKKMENI